MKHVWVMTFVPVGDSDIPLAFSSRAKALRVLDYQVALDREIGLKVETVIGKDELLATVFAKNGDSTFYSIRKVRVR